MSEIEKANIITISSNAFSYIFDAAVAMSWFLHTTTKIIYARKKIEWKNIFNKNKIIFKFFNF